MTGKVIQGQVDFFQGISERIPEIEKQFFQQRNGDETYAYPCFNESVRERFSDIAPEVAQIYLVYKLVFSI